MCKQKIQFDYSLVPLPELSIDVIDISSVISNLIDNAIEATEKSSDPYIKVKITMYGKYLVIYVKNTYSEKKRLIPLKTVLLLPKKINLCTDMVCKLLMSFRKNMTVVVSGNLIMGYLK